MKCPKCGYLGFERVDRCRNCGYDFSFSQHSAPEADLPIRAESDPDEGAQAADLSLSAPVASTQSALTPVLPLFGDPIADDVPLITRPSPPRPPLAVRRATPELPRFKADTARAPMLDLDSDFASPSPPGAWRERTVPVHEASAAESASLFARLCAVVLDLSILAIVDLIVVYFTVQICGLTAQDLGVLPKGPLIAFLLVQNVGYLVAFTAGGQTLGKMAAGIRVVTDDADSQLDLGRAVVRTIVWFVLAIPAGLGFASALFSHDHRGLHDRFSGTRVVRAAPAA
jgi:uncharacterized RDD family membrane protein YckC